MRGVDITRAIGRVGLKVKPVLGPEIARATASAIWAQNRQGLQVNPLQIPQVLDKAASKQLCTGTYKLHPQLVFFLHEHHLARFGPKKWVQNTSAAQRFKGKAIQGQNHILSC